MITVSKANFDKDVLQSDKTIILDFSAEWCGPCRAVAPVLDEIESENDDVVIAKVDVDENPDLAASFGVMSIPALAVIKNGKLTNMSVGALPKEDILRLLSDTDTLDFKSDD
jgi:thioredoxin 1